MAGAAELLHDPLIGKLVNRPVITGAGGENSAFDAKRSAIVVELSTAYRRRCTSASGFLTTQLDSKLHDSAGVELA
jgi:hypothetical protein